MLVNACELGAPRSHAATRRANNPYAEWYANTMKLEDSPTRQYHAENFGPNFDYYEFANQFDEQVSQWNPGEWARLFREAGLEF